jgi:protein-disulfide isomerase
MCAVLNQIARSARSRARTLVPSWARPLAVVLAASLLGACAQGSDAAEATADGSSPIESSAIFAGIPQQGPAIGDPAAPVTVTEFADLRCSHCRDFANYTLPVLLDRYVRAGRVRIVFGSLPILGPASVQAARMAAAVGLQNHEFEFIEAFFNEASGPVTDDVLSHIAGEIPGVDVAEALAQRNSEAVSTALADARSLAIHYSIEGTPSVLLGKTGQLPTLVDGVSATHPATLTGPIDALLAQP